MAKGDRKRAAAAQRVRGDIEVAAREIAAQWSEYGTAGQCEAIALAAHGDPHIAAYIGIRCYLKRLAVAPETAEGLADWLLYTAARNSEEYRAVRP